MTIGEALKAERKRLGLSQSQMTGNLITKSHYSKIERGLFDIRTNDLLKRFLLLSKKKLRKPI